MPKLKYTLLIPLNYNDGTCVPDAERDQIHNELYALGDGYTLAGTVTGAYRMQDGSKQVDHSNEVWIGIDETQISDLKTLAGRICSRLKQEAIYLEGPGGTIEFIPPLTGDAP